MTSTVTGAKNVFHLEDYPSMGTRTYGAHLILGTAITVQAEISLNQPCEGTGNTFQVDVFGTIKEADPCGGKVALTVDGYVPYPMDDSSIAVSYITVNRTGTDVIIWPWGVAQ